MDLRNQILSTEDTKREAVTVPEWGDVTVYVKNLSSKDRDGWEASLITITSDGKAKRVNMINMRARLVVRCLVDENGKRIFSDDDAEALGEKSAAVMARLFDLCQRINALSGKEVAALEKNSVPAQGDDLPLS